MPMADVAFWDRGMLCLQQDKKVPDHICSPAGLGRGWKCCPCFWHPKALTQMQKGSGDCKSQGYCRAGASMKGP